MIFINFKQKPDIFISSLGLNKSFDEFKKKDRDGSTIIDLMDLYNNCDNPEILKEFSIKIQDVYKNNILKHGQEIGKMGEWLAELVYDGINMNNNIYGTSIFVDIIKNHEKISVKTSNYHTLNLTTKNVKVKTITIFKCLYGFFWSKDLNNKEYLNKLGLHINDEYFYDEIEVLIQNLSLNDFLLDWKKRCIRLEEIEENTWSMLYMYFNNNNIHIRKTKELKSEELMTNLYRVIKGNDIRIRRFLTKIFKIEDISKMIKIKLLDNEKLIVENKVKNFKEFRIFNFDKNNYTK